MTGDGLVGKVTRVAPDVAQVTLLTDPTSAVAAVDLRRRRTASCSTERAAGRSSSSGACQEGQVAKPATSSSRPARNSARCRDIYPKGILIGRVASVDQNDVDIFKLIQVEPFADFSSLDSVAILVPRSRR